MLRIYGIAPNKERVVPSSRFVLSYSAVRVMDQFLKLELQRRCQLPALDAVVRQHFSSTLFLQ